MVDWPGLLKWSLQHSDGVSNQPSKFKPMDPETRKWLEEAIKAYTFDEVERMKEIIEIFGAPEPAQADPNDENKRKAALDELLDLVDGPDNAKDFCLIGGLIPLIRIMLEGSLYDSVRELALRVFTSIAQNNMQVQQFSLMNGAMNLLSVVANTTLAKPVQEAAVSAISSLFRGENLAGIRSFIEADGIELVLHVVRNESGAYTLRSRTKAMNFIKGLLSQDDNLDLPHLQVIYDKSHKLGHLVRKAEGLEEELSLIHI
eukprot:TRINITY_DN14069_c0_g1_i2.p1 TRINITY_DN14069_c0_g1~~TRINITY_DN14069_c0_g1_i2.p1  ORF type:complete len:259 (+),score=45.87 TRINITY_DN14069_c0_g1_i2:113-889(+)